MSLPPRGSARCKTGPKIGHKQSAYTVAKRMRTRWNLPPSVIGRLQCETVFVQRSDGLGECWIWTGAVSAKGYGVIHINGKVDYVHRVAYRERCGEIPEGLQIDHVCSVRRCWRHLEPVTGPENMRRWREKEKAA